MYTQWNCLRSQDRWHFHHLQKSPCSPLTHRLSIVLFKKLWPKDYDDFCYNTVNFVFITRLNLTPPYSCLFSCSSPSEIWLKNIYIVRHPRNAEEKRNLKHGSFVCLIKPPCMMMQLSRKSKLLLWYVGFSSSKDSDWHPIHFEKLKKFLVCEGEVDGL